MRGVFVKIAAIMFVFLAGGVISDHHHQHTKLWTNSKGNTKRSTIIFNLFGNVYPQGSYYAEVYVGQPPKPYFLDPDTGSDLTWLQCNAPCRHCIKGYHPLYPPTKELVPRNDPICVSLHSGGVYHRDENVEQCAYEVEYADGLSSRGFLLWDHFSFKITGGTSLSPRLALGCGYDQKAGSLDHPIDGMLGLGRGKASILSQLYTQGLISNVVGHCFSGKKGGGFLFLGDQLYDPNKLSWTPLSQDDTPYYVAGPAELTFDGKSAGPKDLQVVFDSGVTYTYLDDKIYGVLLSLIKKELIGKPLHEAPDDNTLAVCWKGDKPFNHVSDVKQYFKNLVLSFPIGKRSITRFEISPEGYLIISSKRNACLGILNGTDAGLEHNVVGDISMQDKMVVYDNEKRAIGWMVANCDDTPRTTNYTITI